MGQAAAVAAVAPSLLANAAEQFPADIASLYRKSVVIDTLCGPFTGDDALPDAALVDTVRKSGITAINFTISAPTFEGTIDNLAYVDALVEQSPDVFMVVRQYSDIATSQE